MRITMKLYLRRTLVLSKIYWAFIEANVAGENTCAWGISILIL